MSRIQDILAKAEREGTARRTQGPTTFAPSPAPAALAPQPAAAPRVDGTAALEPAPYAARPFEPTPFMPPAETGPAATPGTSAYADHPVMETNAAETRSVSPALHPLLVVAVEPHSAVAERYRTLRARISHREETMPVRTLMITSPGHADGKSITAANLALTMAQEFQRRVVLVDGDLRGGSVQSLFGLNGGPGLSEVLSGEATLEDAMVYLPDYRLTVIPAGRTPQFPTELLGSTAMRRVTDALRGRFDRVLLDVPAVMPLADVGTLAPLADGILMVVRAGVTLRPALDQALAAFDEDRLLGVVLNDTM